MELVTLKAGVCYRALGHKLYILLGRAKEDKMGKQDS